MSDIQIPGVTPGTLPTGFRFQCDHPDGCTTYVTDGPTCDVHARLSSASDERVDEMLAQLNGFIVHEYESGAVVCSDFHLERAVEWARTQPEVARFTEPAFPNLLELGLIDGTVLFWEPTEKQWTVAAMDAAELAAERARLNAHRDRMSRRMPDRF